MSAAGYLRSYQSILGVKYIRIDSLKSLPADIVIERITGDGDKSKLIAPVWSADKISVLGGIDKELARRDTWQGKKFRTCSHR